MNYQLLFQAIQVILNSPNQGVGTGVLGPLQPIVVKYMSNTPMELTVTNQVIIETWGLMLSIANAFFLLLILIGTIQIMISNSTGSLTLPLSQFVPKIIVTALMMNLSFFFGQDLLIVNNLLCGTINANLANFFNTVNNGAKITQGQGLWLYLGLITLLNITLIRLIFQAFERLVLWNLLFVLAPIAILFSFLPQTSSVFSYWGRLFIIVTFTQFVQFLSFTLGLTLLASAGQTGLNGFLLAIAMLLFVAKIPDFLARFPSTSIQGTQGIDQVMRAVVIGARLLL
ncbi:hypothetical protein [Tengunoibacter tsumagoiensis]|uniref:Uncharacterized protein n=1 Tax=Tengunoibacter tsumagoiensis TaxID=2014871 RepID=A0A402A7E5_9CHLR|nr:hypothetical protein [Tengunoibacter tsumagoiensis]GCE15062.1 hypothetical protein KTT_49210 [Tengunoibacter tsumagoiensis]